MRKFLASGKFSVPDFSAASATIIDLERSLNVYREANRIIKNANKNIHLHLRLAKQHRQDIRSLFITIGLEVGDRNALTLAVNNVKQLSSLDRSKFEFGATRRAEKKKLITRPDLLLLTDNTLQNLLAKSLEADSQKDQLRNNIQDIKSRVNFVKNSVALEEAIEKLAQAEYNLSKSRDIEYANAVGYLLSVTISEQSRGTNRPQVFHRAAQLFSKITKGRYRLDIDDGDHPEFRAFDTTTQTGHSLDELSSGTRVQLLIATRIAFIDELETEMALPLILDETLANCDEDRARAIIEAVLELCSDGRQVLYMTARIDEVEKWQAFCAKMKEDDFKIINIASIRHQADVERSPRFHFSPGIIPKPNGLSIDRYTELLNAPGINPRAGISSVDICHLANNSELVYNLRKDEISTWGQLSLLQSGGIAKN